MRTYILDICINIYKLNWFTYFKLPVKGCILVCNYLSSLQGEYILHIPPSRNWSVLLFPLVKFSHRSCLCVGVSVSIPSSGFRGICAYSAYSATSASPDNGHTPHSDDFFSLVLGIWNYGKHI